MAYVFELESVGADTEVHVDAAGTMIVDFALGYDIAADTVILMSVMFVTGDSYLSGTVDELYDLQFGIRIRNLVHGTVSPPDFSSASSVLFIPPESRRHVGANVRNAVLRLLDHKRPHALTMETFHSYLPAKAMAKYHAITTLLLNVGYELQDQFRDEETGIDYWFFSAQVEQTSGVEMRSPND